jgi:hypothetical protein
VSPPRQQQDKAQRDEMQRDEMQRDRDSAGRARNARPRDELGRPLDREAAGEPAAADNPDLTPAEALDRAQRYLDAGRPFHAHEVLEAAWRAAPPGERGLWRGLAQIAVGLTHAQRGNVRGAVSLLRRGALGLAGYAPSCPHGIDATALARTVTELAARIAEGGLGADIQSELTPRLRA